MSNDPSHTLKSGKPQHGGPEPIGQRPEPTGIKPKIGPSPDSGGPSDPDTSSGIDTGAIQPGKTGGATSQ
jgi:hypothetical protein